MAATSELHELQRRSAVERMLEFETVLKDSAAARLSTGGGPVRIPSEHRTRGADCSPRKVSAICGSAQRGACCARRQPG